MSRAGSAWPVGRAWRRAILIERHPNPQDRRSVLITLTSDGQALAPRLAPVFGRVTRQLFNGFSSGEVSALAAALERMRGNLATTV